MVSHNLLIWIWCWSHWILDPSFSATLGSISSSISVRPPAQTLHRCSYPLIQLVSNGRLPTFCQQWSLAELLCGKLLKDCLWALIITCSIDQTSHPIIKTSQYLSLSQSAESFMPFRGLFFPQWFLFVVLLHVFCCLWQLLNMSVESIFLMDSRVISVLIKIVLWCSLPSVPLSFNQHVSQGLLSCSGYTGRVSDNLKDVFFMT